MATKLYLTHQLELPPKFRVITENEDDVFDAIQNLQKQIILHEQAIAELEQDREIVVHSQPIK